MAIRDPSDPLHANFEKHHEQSYMQWREQGRGKLSNCLPDEISLYVMTLSQLFSHSALSLSHYQQCISKHSDQKVNTTKRKQFNTPLCYQQVVKSLEQCPEILLSSCHLSSYLHLLKLHLDWKKCHFQKIHLMRSWMIALCFLLSCFYNPLLVQGCMT